MHKPAFKKEKLKRLEKNSDTKSYFLLVQCLSDTLS